MLAINDGMHMNIDGVEYMSIQEAADFLRVTAGRVRQLIATDAVEHRLIGNTNVVATHSIEAYANVENKRGRPKNAQRATD